MLYQYVFLPGYGTDGTQDYWLVRNSWTAVSHADCYMHCLCATGILLICECGVYVQSWGEEGYIRVYREDTAKPVCGPDNQPQVRLHACGL